MKCSSIFQILGLECRALSPEFGVLGLECRTLSPELTIYDLELRILKKEVSQHAVAKKWRLKYVGIPKSLLLPLCRELCSFNGKSGRFGTSSYVNG